MFNFLRRSRPSDMTAALRDALVDQRLPTGVDPQSLTLLKRRGSYSGRPVSYFRVFDAAQAATEGLAPRKFEDLDTHPELILGAGHLEQGGAVVLAPRRTTTTMAAPLRRLADRLSHGDDDRIVFPDRGPA